MLMSRSSDQIRMRTTLDLPDGLVEEAQRLLGFKSKTDTVVLAQCGGHGGDRIGVLGEGQAAVRGDEVVAVAPGLRRGNQVADPAVAVAHHGNSVAAHLLRGDLEATPRPGECRDDLLNHLLSAGFDRRWRRRAVRALALTGRERLLDLCTGTGDLAIAASTARPDLASTLKRIRRSMPAMPMAESSPEMVVGIRATNSAISTGTAMLPPA